MSLNKSLIRIRLMCILLFLAQGLQLMGQHSLCKVDYMLISYDFKVTFSNEDDENLRILLEKYLPGFIQNGLTEKSDCFTILDRANIVFFVEEENFAKRFNEEVKRLAPTSANVVMMGRIIEIGDRLYLAVKIVDRIKAKVLAAADETFSKDNQEWIKIGQNLACRLLKKLDLNYKCNDNIKDPIRVSSRIKPYSLTNTQIRHVEGVVGVAEKFTRLVENNIGALPSRREIKLKERLLTKKNRETTPVFYWTIRIWYIRNTLSDIENVKRILSEKGIAKQEVEAIKKIFGVDPTQPKEFTDWLEKHTP